MDLIVTPEVGPEEQRALLMALESAELRRPGAGPYEQAWRSAGLRESVEDDDPDIGYAFSPRRTRGATRA